MINPWIFWHNKNRYDNNPEETCWGLNIEMNFFQQPFDGLQGILPYFVSLYLSCLHFRTYSGVWFSITDCLSCLVELSVQHDYIMLYSWLVDDGGFIDPHPPESGQKQDISWATRIN